MTIPMSPNSVHLAADRAVYWAVGMAVFRDVEWSVHGTVDQVVDQVVFVAVYRAVQQAVRTSPPHPNLDRLLAEVRQTKVGAP